MKKIVFAYFLIAAGFTLFNACEKECLTHPEPVTYEEKDGVDEFSTEELTVADLLESSGENLIGYLDDTEKLLFADFEQLEALKEQFQPLETLEELWIIEKNGAKGEYLLVPIFELNPDKLVGEEDEITRKNEFCKKVTQCFYGRTHKKYFRFPKDSPEACVVREDETCTGKKKSFEVETHSEDDCVSPDKDADGNVILKKITILVCSR